MSKRDFVKFVSTETFGRILLIITFISICVSFVLLLLMYI